MVKGNFILKLSHSFLLISLNNVPRIAYAVWLLTQIAQRQPEDVKILVMYDIGCTLVRHLKVDPLYDDCLR